MKKSGPTLLCKPDFPKTILQWKLGNCRAYHSPLCLTCCTLLVSLPNDADGHSDEPILEAECTDILHAKQRYPVQQETAILCTRIAALPQVDNVA